MKKTFPKYDYGTLLQIQSKFKDSDKILFNKFLVFCSVSGGKTTTKKYSSVLTKIIDVFDGDMLKIDLERLRSFLSVLNESDLLPATKNEIKKVLKRFLKENYDDWSLRFKGLKDIRLEKDINQQKINANTILRPGDIELLVRGTSNLMYKAFVITLYESAARPEEILKIKWKDIDFNNKDIKLLSSKTGNLRINPICSSIYHLERWRNEYFFINPSSDDWVFVNYQNRNKHISVVSACRFLSRLSKRVLGRSIFTYIIRHTRGTELQKVLPPKIYEKFMDHSIQTATRYSHLSKDDVRDVMFKNVYSVKNISPQKKHELEIRIEKLEHALFQSMKIIKKISRTSHHTGEVIPSFPPTQAKGE
jgi:integrase